MRGLFILQSPAVSAEARSFAGALYCALGETARGMSLLVRLRAPASVQDAALASEPSNDQFLHAKGYACLSLPGVSRRDRAARAAPLLSRAASLRPDCLRYLRHAADALRHADRAAESLPLLERALSLAPASERRALLSHKAKALKALRRYEDAAGVYDEAR